MGCQVMLQIKGVREGLLVTVSEGDWLEAQAALLTQIEERSAFFNGARLALDVGNRTLHAAEMGVLRDKLSDANICLWAVISKSAITAQTAEVLGIATQLSKGKAEKHPGQDGKSLPGEEAVFIEKTLRSGNRIVYTGHVVVIGDVNPGAEIQAGGSVIVWGTIRGSVHAGTDGNRSAVICALEINPLQLRIANQFLIEKPKKKKHGPETARIRREQIVLEPWNLK